MNTITRETYPWDEVYYSNELYETQFRARWMIPLFACESGSRAWGFASKNSDYDVRFIYCRPKNYYLSLEPRPDTVSLTLEQENGDTIDAVGWDIRKFLKLVAKSNATPFEWVLACPRYYAEPSWLAMVMPVMFQHMDAAKMAYHYRGLATKHWHRYIESKGEVTHKKYLYILRAIWNLEWYVAGNDGVAPISFFELLLGSKAPSCVLGEAMALVSDKIAGNELGLAAPNLILDDYIASRVFHWKNGFGILPSTEVAWESLNNAFKNTLV